MMRVLDSYWFGQGVVLVMCLGIVVVAAIITPSDEMLSLFGQDIPVMCSFRRYFGIGCPGCGLTRSFTYMAHLDVRGAFAMNWMGPPMFLLVLSQVPYRAYTLWRGPIRGRRRARRASV